MRRLQPVIWTKGTILTPQHLQSQDLFFEQVLQFRLEALNFRPWGFRRLGISEEALQAGLFALSRAQGIFPDGLPFDIPDSDPAPPPKPLADYFQADVESVDLYLAIPHYRERGLNIAPDAESADARYVAEVALVRDENWDRTERPIQIARKNFRLLTTTETRQGAGFLRVARVRRSPTGIFELDPRFVPPLLDIAASDYLMAVLRRLIEILAARSSMLSGMRRQKNQTLADFTSADIANFWLLYTINSHFPLLRHLFETRRGHPGTLFEVMTSLAGALTTFSLKIQPRDLPVYDHDELGACFADLDEKLRFLLETVVPANFVSLPLKLVEPSIYATALAEERYLTNTRMYLAIQAEMNEADLITKAPLLIKVCSATHIEHLVRQALPGVRLIHTPQPPASIPIKLNYQYFALNQSGGAWEAISRARNFAAYVPADFPNPQLELIILLPQSS